MIRFDKVTYQNFLAAGNVPVVVDLDKHITTLVVGGNGTGKSTTTEAVSFAAFGKPLRKVTKGSLVNSINGRDCLVELDFTTSSGTYKIRRGIKPNIFEIWKNGELLPQPANVDDYQTMLETTILKLNHKSFMQVVVLGSASYTPFMRLSASARRDIIEDLLDIEVFSSMNALAKEDLLELKADLDTCHTKRQLVGQQVQMAESFAAQLEEQDKAVIDHIDAQIAQTEASIADVERQQKDLQKSLASYAPVKTKRDAALQKQRQYEKTLSDIHAKIRQVERDRQFYEEHDNCPECEQTITEEFKQSRFASFDQKKTDATEAIAKCEALITKYRTQAETLESTLGEATRLSAQAHALDGKLAVHRKRLKELQSERLAALQPKKTQPAVDIDALRKDLDALHDEHDQLSRKRVVVDAACMLLKDNGIKTRLIRHYLPIINKTINHYLTAMDFPILFQFDESFNESMKSRYRDDFSYESFSEGEKKRIDLALLLTWRAIARLKNSASTNLLILDEVFDSSLDLAGTEEFLKIIQALESDTNVFVISHKTDQLMDKFSQVLVFEKHRGFSQLKVA